MKRRMFLGLTFSAPVAVSCVALMPSVAAADSVSAPEAPRAPLHPSTTIHIHGAPMDPERLRRLMREIQRLSK